MSCLCRESPPLHGVGGAKDEDEGKKWIRRTGAAEYETGPRNKMKRTRAQSFLYVPTRPTLPSTTGRPEQAASHARVQPDFHGSSLKTQLEPSTRKIPV